MYSACILLAAGRRSPSAFVMAITSAISTMPFFIPCVKKVNSDIHKHTPCNRYEHVVKHYHELCTGGT